MSCSKRPSMIGSLVGVLLLETTRLTLHAAERFAVGRKGELGEYGTVVVQKIRLRDRGEVPGVALAANRHVVPAPLTHRARQPRRALQHPELAAREVHGDRRIGRRVRGEDVHRSADGGAAIERGVGTAHDLDARRVGDRQRDNAGPVVREGLRHTVDQQEGVREFGIASRHAPEHHRIEDAELRAHDCARNMSDRLRERLIAAALDRLAADDVGLRGHVADAQGRLGRRDLHALHEIRRRIELDRQRNGLAGAHLDAGHPLLEKSGRTDNHGGGSRR
jgi:hypothetical protein